MKFEYRRVKPSKKLSRFCGNCKHCKEDCLSTDRCGECYFDKSKPRFEQGRSHKPNNNELKYIKS